ncbi:flagellin [Silvibacterium bohemicum]|uniref:Flagellin n=1 Tax=Silvibacterium bohemicum TaxID=1577686 RepID=A0A841K1H1_9BACT|nr:flagellin [Silvibacterium bohemicum]MBB6145031.1 flagellin [Silvibacterium bohemicum]
MSITLLNNISALVAENAVSNTQASLQNTLTQLSTGLKINSGADDPAGLSIADGLGANIAALTQSSQNASNGIGLLQTADGALSQVTNVLNQAVTIATEASNGGLTTDQATALNTEFTAILSEINTIGQTTNFNGTSVFNNNNTDSLASAQGSVASPLALTTVLTTGDSVTINDSATGGTFKFTAAAGDTVGDLQTAINNAVTAGTLSAGTTLTIPTAGGAAANQGQVVIATTTTGDSLQITSNDPTLGTFAASTNSADNASFFTSDGTGGGASTTTTSISNLSAAALGLTATGVDLTSATDAKTALTAITAAISTIAAQRGDIGASVNQLTAVGNVENTEVQNLTNAQNNVQNADIASTTSKLTQFNILEQTGFDALSQANSAEQNVLKLLQ